MKRAIVIGATSGIGRGLAECFAAQGYAVGLVGRRGNLIENYKEIKETRKTGVSFGVNRQMDEKVLKKFVKKKCKKMCKKVLTM